MPSDVFFTDMRAHRGRSLLQKMEELFEKAAFPNLIKEGDFVAIKIHCGERGNTAYVRPIFIRRVVEKVRAYGGKPFLTDTNTLYVSSRANALDHLITAIENGFDYTSVGAPFIIADGLNGRDYVPLKIDGRFFKEVKISSAIYHADVLIAISHFKGHETTGFGGTLKNVGMGCGCRSAKQMMHSDILPVVDLEKCTGCGKCLKWCPAQAIILTGEKKAQIDHKKCLGCGECVVTCPSLAIAISWEAEPHSVQKKMVEHVYGVLKSKENKVGFMNFLINVTPSCDCWGWSDAPIVPDIGILASRDPVALDQASVDLINRTRGIENTGLSDPQSKDKFESLTGVDWSVQLKYGEELGLGSREYNLIKI